MIREELMWYYNITVQDNNTGATKTFKHLEGPLDDAIDTAIAMYKKDCEFYSAVHIPLYSTMEVM